MNVNSVKKDTLIKKIEEDGCDMLKNNLDGNETKEEIIDFLKECECKSLKKIFSGI